MFGWVPVLGTSLKVGYISKRAYEVVNGVKIDPDKASLQGADLENYLDTVSEDAYNEFIEPELSDLGVPEVMTGTVSKKAISIISGKLKEKYIKKVQ